MICFLVNFVGQSDIEFHHNTRLFQKSCHEAGWPVLRVWSISTLISGWAHAAITMQLQWRAFDLCSHEGFVRRVWCHHVLSNGPVKQGLMMGLGYWLSTQHDGYLHQLPTMGVNYEHLLMVTYCSRILRLSN